MDKVILVTGASRGLGEAIVRTLARQGCKVMACARSEEKLRELWDEHPNVKWVACDLAKPGQSARLVEKTLEAFGQLDGLVNNAGIIHPIARLADADPDAWAEAITVNLTAPAALMTAALPQLKKQNGRVVNISSGAAVKVVQGWSAYCTSKAGLLHLTNIAAVEYPEVAFFSLRPGVIDTEMQGDIRESSGMTEQDLTKFRGLKSSESLEPPEVPGRAAAWLVLHGPLERSGDFIEYTDQQIVAGVDKMLATI